MRLAALKDSSMHAPALARARLLVAEDEPLIAMDIGGRLEEEGATVFPARSVRHAIRLIETSSLSAGVVDIRLGNDDAEPVCETLARHQVPFVFYTGQSAAVRKRWAASPVVTKPAAAAAIVGAIKYTLAADKRDLLSSISADPTIVNFDQHIADGEERIVRIRRLIRRLQKSGFDTSAAENLVATMSASVELIRDHRRLLASEWRRSMPLDDRH
jgi:DNA-binding response OmpR family regulator